MIPKVGEAIGPFTLERVLGQGGMGAVFIARHQNGVECALKVLLDPNPDILERFKREIAAMGRVDRHPGVVRVHTAGTFGPQALPYVVMDLVKGSDLSKMIGGRPMEPSRAATMVAEIAEALEFCHAKGVIHRDMKPANVLVRADDGRPVVTDFGLARDDTAERLTKTGEVLGTPAYMAPEQLEGDRTAQDRRTDVYALGAILYECLTGEQPFKADSPTRLMKMVLLDDPVDPRKKVPAVPAELAVIALKCLAKERERRYQTAKGVAEELERFRRGEPILAKPETAAEKKARWKKNHYAEWLLRRIAVATVVLGAAGGYAAYKLLVTSSIEEVSKTARASAERAGFPVVPPPGQKLPDEHLANMKLLRDKAGTRVATDREAHRLDVWTKLSTEREATLAALAPETDELVQSFAAVAALQLRDAKLRESVAKAVADGGPRKLLALHGSGPLAQVLDTVASLDSDSKTVWRSELLADLERAAKIAAAAKPISADALAKLLRFAEATPDIPFLSTVARWVGPGGWTALFKDKDARADAERFALKLVDAPEDVRSVVADAISASIEDAIPTVESGKSLDLNRIVPALGELELLKWRPTEAVLAKLSALVAEADTKFIQRDASDFDDTIRVEVLVALVASGIMPQTEKLLRPPKKLKESDKRRAERTKARGAQAETVAKDQKVPPLLRLVAALALIACGMELDSLKDDAERGGEPDPESDSERWYARATEYFEAARAQLVSPSARAFAAYERTRLLLRGALRGPGLVKNIKAMHDEGQLAKAQAQLDEVKSYSRPWAILETRALIAFRRLERITEDVCKRAGHRLKDGKTAATPDEARAILGPARAALEPFLPLTVAWRAALEEVLAEAQVLAKARIEGEGLDRARLTRNIELSNIYGMERGDTLSDPVKLRLDARRRVATVAKLAGDRETCVATATEAERELRDAIAAIPEKVSLRHDLAEVLALLDRKGEARKVLEDVLHDRSLGELEHKDKRRAEELLESLK